MFLIKPVKGKSVLDPETMTAISEDGLKVETVSTYWFRRESDGDVKISEIETKSTEEKAEPKKGAK